MSDYDDLIKRVDEALDSVRPHLEVDGGNVEIVEITEDKTLKVRWLGNCEACVMSMMTMKAGIEEAVKRKVPEIEKVEAVNGISLPQ